MKPVVHFELTGSAIKTVLGLLATTAVILALVWLIAGPTYALAGGIAVVVLVRAVYALLIPSSG